MKKLFSFIFFIILLSSSTLLNAQIKIIKVWPEIIPGAINNPNIKEDTLRLDNRSLRIRDVIDPTITIFTPAKEKFNGTSIIICPGGGYGRLSIDHEGEYIAKWLNEFGITGVVLKYRLPNDTIMKNKSIGPFQDVQEAIRIVRRNAKEWKLNSDKIGIIGFSAGGHLASTASAHFAEKVYDSDSVSARPDFTILIYPVISMNPDISHSKSRTNLLGDNPDKKLEEFFSNELQVTEETPPTFIVHAFNDKTVPIQNSINYFLALKKFNIPSEMHVYESGGHGFGLAKNGADESQWPDACIRWLISHEYISK